MGTALADFVIMVRELEIKAAAMNIDCLFPLEGLLDHRRALDVPSRPTFPEGRVPARLSFLHGLPQSKIFMEFFDLDLVHFLILHFTV